LNIEIANSNAMPAVTLAIALQSALPMARGNANDVLPEALGVGIFFS
jgi:hypothetical protein